MEYIIVNKSEFISRLNEFCDLYKLCFNQEMTLKEAEWRYINNPVSDFMACFCIDNGKLVANYSVSPMLLSKDNREIKAAQSLNTMTHPDYAGKGIFVEMATMIYDELERKGYELVYGFPNYISNRTFVEKLGWKDIYEIPMLELNLSSYRKLNNADELVQEDSEFVTDVSLSLFNSKKIQVKRTNEYLRWRYYEHPNNTYKSFVIKNDEGVIARIVCKEYKDRLNIIDFEYVDVKDMKTLIEYCLSYAVELGKNYVTTWAQLGTLEHLYFEKRGFRNSAPVTYLGARVFSNDNSFYEYGNWHVCLGDDNVF